MCKIVESGEGGRIERGEKLLYIVRAGLGKMISNIPLAAVG